MKTYKLIIVFTLATFFLSEFSNGQQNHSSKNSQHIAVNSDKTNFSLKPFTPSFVQNKGQFDKYDININQADLTRPAYGSQMGNAIVLFNKNSIQFVENVNKKKVEDIDEKEQFPEHEFETFRQTMTFVNANPSAEFITDKSEQGYYTYPDPAIKNGTITANAWKSLTLKNIYSGIDVVYSFKDEGGIEYSFIIQPGADASVIKVNWSGVDNLFVDQSGNLQMESQNGNFTDKAPISYYQNEEISKIDSRFSVKDKIVSFSLSDYDHSKTLVIDPWVVNPNFTTYNSAYDIEHDPSGNIYVYGGASPYQLKKFTSNGVPIWAYNTSASGYYGDFTLDAAGNAYVIYGPWNDACLKINPLGTLVWSVINSSNNSDEIYRIYPNPANGQLEIMGMKFDSTGFIRPMVVNIDPNTGGYSPYYLYPTALKGEDRCMSVDANGDAFGLVFSAVSATSIPATNILWKVNSANTTLTSVQDGYSLTESEPSNTDSDFSGYNGTAVSSCAVFTYDGITVKKWDKTTLALQGSVVIPGGIAYTTAGLCTDSCGNVYVGGPSSIIEYDNNLTLVTSVATTGRVYGVNNGNVPGEILACGQGFFGSYTFPVCTTSTTDSSENINVVSCQSSSVNLVGATNGTGYIWSTGATTDSITVTVPGMYWVHITGATLCAQTVNIADTFNVSFYTPPFQFLFSNNNSGL
jgi:hypothetical protein